MTQHCYHRGDYQGMSNLLEGLPSSIRVGPYDLAVIITDKIDDDEGKWGQHHPGVSIELRRDQKNAQSALDTLFHEINHAIYGIFGLSKKSREEHIVSAMAAGWAMVYRDNPDLLAWVYRMMRPRHG